MRTFPMLRSSGASLASLGLARFYRRGSDRHPIPAEDLNHLLGVRRTAGRVSHDLEDIAEVGGSHDRGAMIVSCFASSVPKLSNRWTVPRGMHTAWPGPTS